MKRNLKSGKYWTVNNTVEKPMQIYWENIPVFVDKLKSAMENTVIPEF